MHREEINRRTEIGNFCISERKRKEKGEKKDKKKKENKKERTPFWSLSSPTAGNTTGVFMSRLEGKSP